MFNPSESISSHGGRPRWFLLAMVTALLVSIMPLAVQAAWQAEAIINDQGGSSGDPGLKIHYANGEIQVVRDGAYQFSTAGQTPGNPPDNDIDNAIAVVIGTTPGLTNAYTPSNNIIHERPFADATQTGGSLAGSGTIAGTLDTGAGVDVDVTIDYVYPNDYFTVTLDVNRSAPTAEIRLYHFFRSWLGNSSQGPGFYTPSPATVGVEGTTTSEALRYVSGPAWTGYFSGNFGIPHGVVEGSQDFNNAIDTTPTTHNGFGIMWNLGTAAGTQTVSYQVMFGDVAGAPDQPIAPTAIAGNASATVTLTPPADNGSTITGYTVTANPGALTCSVTPPAIACTVSGLTNGTAYTFTATATNGVGTSAASLASNPVTPTSPPGDNPVLPPRPAFTDIPAGEMADAASWLAAEGITNGCVDGPNPQFCPSALATRAQGAAFLSRALGLQTTTVNAFTDDEGHQLEDHLNRTSVAGIFLGCTNDDKVCPDAEITRGELAAVLVRALGLTTSSPATFTDAESHWAQSFIEIIGGLGITIGCTTDGENFCPNSSGTRGEIALLLYRALRLG